MTKNLSNNERAVYETIKAVGLKTSFMAILFTILSFVSDGHQYVDIWQVLIPLSLAAWLIGFWAAGKIPDDADKTKQ